MDCLCWEVKSDNEVKEFFLLNMLKRDAQIEEHPALAY